MRIPPYYRSQSWQRFFAGMAVGAIVSWFIFLYIHGVWMERKTKENRDQEEQIEKLIKEKEIWQEDFKALNKQNEELLTVQEISVKIVNSERYKLDSLSVFEVEQDVKDDIDMMMAKDLDTVFKSRDLVKRAIENKIVRINQKRYRLEVKTLFVYTKVSIQLEIHLE